MDSKDSPISSSSDTTEAKNLGSLNAYQAILDIPVFIGFANKQFNLNPDVRWVLWGSGYGGFLAAQARRMFPQQVEGVIASSAPMTLKYDFWGEFKVSNGF